MEVICDRFTHSPDGFSCGESEKFKYHSGLTLSEGA